MIHDHEDSRFHINKSVQIIKALEQARKKAPFLMFIQRTEEHDPLSQIDNLKIVNSILHSPWPLFLIPSFVFLIIINQSADYAIKGILHVTT